MKQQMYMNMMKGIIFFLLVSVSVLSCKKDRETLSGDAEISVAYPEGFTESIAEGVSVTATNVQNGSTQQATTDALGVAHFSGLQVGTYSFRAEQRLDAAAALVLTGTESELFLNAVVRDISIAQNEMAKRTLTLNGAPLAGLVFKEVYYTGSKTPTNAQGMQTNYFSDQFIELYNNSDETIYLDGLCIGDLHGVSGIINPGNAPSPLIQDKDHVYVSNVWRVPGSGQDHPLLPGESIIIAQDGVNHKEFNPNSPVDLSGADWETYNERPDGRDADNPDVPNLECMYFTGGFDWLITVFGPSVVIFRADDFDDLEKVPDPDDPAGEWLDPVVKLPVSDVIDSFEALKDANSGSFKRIPVALNSGFVFASDTYTMESFRRKIVGEENGRKVLQNTNDSEEDFEKLALPTPKRFD